MRSIRPILNGIRRYGKNTTTVTMLRRPGIKFDDLAKSAAKILASKGYSRLESEPGWCWQNDVNRVCFSAPPSAHPKFPYVVTRERIHVVVDDPRTLHRAPAARNFAAHETPERVAKVIEEKLENPD